MQPTRLCGSVVLDRASPLMDDRRMTNDGKVLVGVVVIGAGAVLALSFVDDFNKQALAPLAALIVGGLSAGTAIHLDARRRADEQSRRDADRQDAQAQRVHEKETRAEEMRERARQIAIPLQHQFALAAGTLRQGSWPELADVEVDLPRKREDALVSRLQGHYLVVTYGLAAMRDLAGRAQTHGWQRVADDDRWLANLRMRALEMAAEALDEATWDEDRVEQQERNVEELADELLERLTEEMARSK
jgi:hypothetical protein